MVRLFFVGFVTMSYFGVLGMVLQGLNLGLQVWPETGKNQGVYIHL